MQPPPPPPAAPQRPNTLHIVSNIDKSSLKADSEWSTSSIPSSPGGNNHGSHRSYDDDALMEIEETTMINPVNVECQCSVACETPDEEDSHAPISPTSHHPPKMNNLRQGSSRVAQMSGTPNSTTVAGQATTGELDNPSELDPSSSDSGTLARCTVVRPLKIRFCRPSSAGSVKKSSKAKRQVLLVLCNCMWCKSSYEILFIYFGMKLWIRSTFYLKKKNEMMSRYTFFFMFQWAKKTNLIFARCPETTADQYWSTMYLESCSCCPKSKLKFELCFRDS